MRPDFISGHLSIRKQRQEGVDNIVDKPPAIVRNKIQFLRSSNLTPLRTSIASPWQNGTAERWVGSVRRELLDHVIIPLNEYHLRRLGRAYIVYYHADSAHIAVNKSTPAQRVVEHRSAGRTHLINKPRIGGLHHR